MKTIVNLKLIQHQGELDENSESGYFCENEDCLNSSLKGSGKFIYLFFKDLVHKFPINEGLPISKGQKVLEDIAVEVGFFCGDNCYAHALTFNRHYRSLGKELGLVRYENLVTPR